MFPLFICADDHLSNVSVYTEYPELANADYTVAVAVNSSAWAVTRR